MHTLSEPTRKTLAKLEDKVEIKAYLTEDLPPGYRMGRRRIEEILREYEALSDGKLELTIIDPIETKSEDAAQKRGIRVLQLPDPKRQFVRAYLGLTVWCKAKAQYETIPALSYRGVCFLPIYLPWRSEERACCRCL